MRRHPIILSCLLISIAALLVFIGCTSSHQDHQQSITPTPTSESAEPNSPTRAQRAQAADSLLIEAVELRREQQYEQAIGRVEDALRLDPQHPAAQMMRDQLQYDVLLYQSVRLERRVGYQQGLHSIENTDTPRPYADVIQYPDLWPELTQSRLATQAHAVGGVAARYTELNLAGRVPRNGEQREQTQSALTTQDFDEVWVIERRPAPRAQPRAHDDLPRSGAMRARVQPEEDNDTPGGEFVPLPLQHTSVAANVAGYLASVDVTQTFHNPFDQTIEAQYAFPLPDDAAVHEFILTIGERRIHGIIREREEAQRIYHEARAAGRRAALLTQERPNLFTQRVANLTPGDDINVTLSYLHPLAYADGGYVFHFPMVVGPRFNPPQTSDGIGTAPQGNPGASGQDTEVQYLRPDQRSGHDIDLTVTLDAGMPIEQITSRTHAINIQPAVGNEQQAVTISLAGEDNIPNRDFVLHYRLAGDQLKSGLVTHHDERGSFFSLMLVPPAELESLPRQPMEWVFVLDCSGSMSGVPLHQAKQAVRYALDQLNPRDSFQIIRFSSDASALGHTPLIATAANLERGRDYLDSLDSGGDTMMIEGIKASLEFPHDPLRYRVVCFLTDGYIGNEAEILAAIGPRLASPDHPGREARIFSFGVGDSVNRYLMQAMARHGRGAAGYVGLNEDATEVMQFFLQRASRPAMTHLELDTGGLIVDSVNPRRLPDLYVGRPIVLTGRFTGELPDQLRITGQAGGQPYEITVDTARAATHEGVALIWARHKIQQLADAAVRDAGQNELEQDIMNLALSYGLMSPYTAFLAIDSTETVDPGNGVTVQQAVPVPDGVRYETTVPEGVSQPVNEPSHEPLGS